MLTTTRAPAQLTALLEHARTLLGADHAAFTAWDSAADIATTTAASGTLTSPIVAEPGFANGIGDYVPAGAPEREWDRGAALAALAAVPRSDHHAGGA